MPLDLKHVANYVGENIDEFHTARLESLKKLKLQQILKNKNPYLFKAKNVIDAHDLVKMLLDAHLSSQEETMFGKFLEELAIYICGQVYKGRKSSAEGIDLEFDKGGTTYIVSIKSGPNWGNSSQVAKMKDHFRKARRILRTSNSKKNVVAVNGCCYGRDNQPEKEEYSKLCGQRFWEFISGEDELYMKIIEPLGHKAKEKNEEFNDSYTQLINNFTVEFSKDFCDDGVINWERLVKFNSAKE
ncbi:MAG: cytosolic protein [Chloroflexi bacterium]|nr:cytosolic protein [Chloroflexota bacterium]